MTITTIQGDVPGKTVAIFCGVHGNERAGILAIEKLRDSLEIDAGTVHLVITNEPAIEQNVRLVNKNLNRIFIPGSAIETYEDEIARDLMELLNTCDGLLDFHSYNDNVPNRTVFAITEKNSLDIARRLNVSKILTGFDAFQPGSTDGYMIQRGKIGICVELGSSQLAEEMAGVGVTIARQFLAAMGLVDAELSKQPKEEMEVRIMYRKHTDDFRFYSDYKTFDAVPAGTVVAHDGVMDVTSCEDAIILFPREDGPTGVEAFLLAEEIHHCDS